MRQLILSAIAVSTVVLFSGCANKVPNYASSIQNIRAVKALASEEKTTVDIAPFSAKNEGESKVMCRLATPIGAPDGVTFAKYIEDALAVELEMGNMYDPKSNTKITGYIEDLYGSTVLGNAYWEFKVKVSSSNGKSFDVLSRYDYESSFNAYSACSEMQRSYLPAVQQLVNKIVTDPRFKELLKS
jgi:outer membrane murein-binding lipoprotein Lpp